MPDLVSSTLFKGSNDINPDDLGTTEVTNFNTSVDKQLRDHHRWQETMIGVVGLSLSPDNTKVIGGTFITRGKTGLKEKRLPCSNIWPNSSPVVLLVVNFPSANIFKFEEGGLWSNIVPSSDIIHSFHLKDGRVVLAEEREKLRIGDFCARIVCQLSSTSNGKKGVILKYSIILFPGAADEVCGNAESRFPGWPGLKFGEGTFPLGPTPTAAWRCPCIPFTIPGVPYSEIPMAPSSDRLRMVISAIMRATKQPDTLRNGEFVLEKWSQIRAHPRELSSNAPLVEWPQAPSVPEEQGKKLSFNCTRKIKPFNSTVLNVD